MTGRDFDCVNQNLAEFSQTVDFETGQRQPKSCNPLADVTSALETRITDHPPTTTQIFYQCAVRLEPFPLLQLETKTEALPLKQLRRVNCVGGEQSSILCDKHAAGATVGRTTTQISTGREPGNVRRILQEHRVSSHGRQKRSDSFLLFLNVSETAFILNQATTAGCIIHAARAH
jgi:hypothetical protein